NEDLWKEYKKSLKEDDLDIIERAYRFFYVNRTSHNGIGGFSMNTIIRRNMSKSISDMLSAIDRLDELHQRLSKLIVTNKNAFELIEKYKDNENVFMYLDPPYHQSTRTAARYEVDMTNEQHYVFINLVLNSKAKMLISGYDCEPYNKLVENGWEKIQFEVNTVSGNKKPKTKIETLWKNY
ncbi:MAG: DNA adenine methylase, partial [Bacilli bacterium]|nr:DNA adenine methylase [Bacilli bacterium]